MDFFQVRGKLADQIPFHYGKTNAILSFLNTIQKSTTAKNTAGYELCFAKELLDKEALRLSEKLELFKSEVPVIFLISRHQEWRVKEIFESLLDESIKTNLCRNEMMRTLIHIPILFSQRLITIDTNPYNSSII
ncbi:hypothetical protein [Mucilaginibacter pocheonensis]|uniref:Uncharacterized protein n=1 Tax=Mucilaginibacter pocheonensis TaxID=398050 RepID=A0ABU1T863_9SPHI|nr:hypothetical protein [Mucilaginibacter pocheonensis]MDR6941564.1 hypothetical protein [Mucilaginibacter pocheonensis]